MCVSASPFEGFTPSSVLTGDLQDGRQLLVYANGVSQKQELSFGHRTDTRSNLGAAANSNAMLLHVPAHVDSVGLLPASSQQLTELGDTLHKIPLPRISTVYYSGMRSAGGLSMPATYSQGAYDITFAAPDRTSVSAATEALHEKNANYVPPTISDEMLAYYEALGKKFGALTLVIAGFNPSRGMDAHPIAVTYASVIDDIFAPGLEEHTGKPPVDERISKRDFRVFLAGDVTFSTEDGFGFDYEMARGFHEQVVGANSDFIIPRETLERVQAFSEDSPVKVAAAGLKLYGASAPHRAAQWTADFEQLVAGDKLADRYAEPGMTAEDKKGQLLYLGGYHMRDVRFPSFGPGYKAQSVERFSLGPRDVNEEIVATLAELS